MTAVARLVTRAFFTVCLTTLTFVPPAPGGAGDSTSAGETPSASSEVRLRKLHLVRPDLIPYPIAYEVCC